MLLSEKPFTVVFDEFLNWIKVTIDEVSESSSADHYPGDYCHNYNSSYLIIHY